MRNKADYDAITAKLDGLGESLAASVGENTLYFTNEGVDRENVCELEFIQVPYTCNLGFTHIETEINPVFWEAMCQAAENAAGVRAEDYGIAIQDHGINY
jgi:hypothetical protein